MEVTLPNEQYNAKRRARYASDEPYRNARKEQSKDSNASRTSRYQSDPEFRAKRIADNTKAQAEKRAFVHAAKAIGCWVCGEMRLHCLDFHHVNPEQKSFMLAYYPKHTLEDVIAEIEKCDVLCANCHRDRHFQDAASTTKEA